MGKFFQCRESHLCLYGSYCLTAKQRIQSVPFLFDFKTPLYFYTQLETNSKMSELYQVPFYQLFISIFDKQISLCSNFDKHILATI